MAVEYNDHFVLFLFVLLVCLLAQLLMAFWCYRLGARSANCISCFSGLSSTWRWPPSSGAAARGCHWSTAALPWGCGCPLLLPFYLLSSGLMSRSIGLSFLVFGYGHREQQLKKLLELLRNSKAIFNFGCGNSGYCRWAPSAWVNLYWILIIFDLESTVPN